MSLPDPSGAKSPAARQRALSFTSQSYGPYGPEVKSLPRRKLGAVSRTRPPAFPGEDVAAWDEWSHVAPYLTLDDFDDDGTMLVARGGVE